MGVLRCSALGGRVLWPLVTRDGCIGHPDEMPDRKDAAEVCDELLGWLDDRPRDRPFFAFLNLYDAHNPYIPPRDFRRPFGRGPARPSDRLILLEWFIRKKGDADAARAPDGERRLR